jgi:dTDP-4-dehydrorhamnose 3,5-epimerase
MEYTESPIPGLWIIEPKIFSDSRGYFVESYKQQEFDQHIGATRFIQDNESQSSFGVLRGLHFQSGDTAQAKLVRVIQGKVWDVAVDIRKDSPTFGQHYALELSAENKIQFFISRGFAHGFLVLSDTAIFQYKVDNVYSPGTEQTINCLDPDLNIQWPMAPESWIMSEKDKLGTLIKDILL